MNVYWLIGFFFLHWVGDFVCQFRWLADNKSKNFFALLLHGAIYTLVLALGTILIVPESTPLYEDPWMIWLGVNCFLHILIDFFSSRTTAKLQADGKTYAFFTVIGLDQFLHIASILATTRIFLS
jgi:hypothetical protein